MQAKDKGLVGFVCQDIGEFWYELKLEANKSPPISLPDMAAPLGKCSTQLLTLENPLSQPVSLDISVSNPRDFQIVYPPRGASISQSLVRQQVPAIKVSVSPMTSIQVEIVFWPSSLTEERRATIEVTSMLIGTAIFQVKGTGLLPEVMDTVQLTSYLGQTVSGLITFWNPLIDPIPITVSLKDTNQNSQFALLNRRINPSIGGQEKMEITFTFTPTVMKCFENAVIVEMSPQLRWIFPIKGTPERLISNQPLVLECRSRDVIDKNISVFGEEIDWTKIFKAEITEASVSLDNPNPLQTAVH
eukprot:jgi/Hompol1/4439/HPOL_001781-RA